MGDRQARISANARAVDSVANSLDMPLGAATSNLAVTTAAAAITTLAAGATYRVTTNVEVFLLCDAAVDATTANGMPMAADTSDYFTLPDGRVSAITASGSGTVYFTRMAQ